MIMGSLSVRKNQRYKKKKSILFRLNWKKIIKMILKLL